MFCRKCGQRLPEDSEFCTRCGCRVIAPRENDIEEIPELEETVSRVLRDGDGEEIPSYRRRVRTENFPVRVANTYSILGKHKGLLAAVCAVAVAAAVLLIAVMR